MTSPKPIKTFEIHLEHDIDEQYQYEPGETLRGDVVLAVNEEIRVLSLQVQIRGEATVSWDDETTGGQFSAKEAYVDNTVDVPLTEEATLGKSNKSAANKVVTVSRGEHRYPIEIPLPTTLPSSFIGKYGSITYVLKATLREDKLMGLGTTITSEPFLVLRRLDIREDINLQQPVTVTLKKRIAGTPCFCLGGQITADFIVAKTGHLPGEDIVIDAEINNDSTKAIKSVQVALVLNSTFHAKNKVRNHSQVVNKKSDACDVDYDDTRRWSAVRLPVPPYIPESRLDGCDMIDIVYELQFRLELDGGAGEIKDAIPITIGTIQDARRLAQRRRTIISATANGDVNIGDDQYEAIGNEGIGGNMEDIDLEMPEDDLDAFRHPMAPGETRKNILYADFGD